MISTILTQPPARLIRETSSRGERGNT